MLVILLMLFIVLVVLSLLLVDYPSDNKCVFEMIEKDIILFQQRQHQLRKLPSRIPAVSPLPTRLKIPNILVQTIQSLQVPSQMYETMVNNIEMNPHFEYRLYSSADRRAFMKSMGERYLKIYDSLLPAAYQADVFRYSALYRNGGCYMDAGSFTVRPLAELLSPQDEFVSSEDSYGNGLNSAFFCAVKGSRVLEYTLQLIEEAVQRRDYGRNSLDITGPYRFIEGLRKYLSDHELTTQERDFRNGVRLFSRQYSMSCFIAKIHSKGQTFIVSKYPGYIADMGWYTKRERYGPMWDGRRVFRKNDSGL